MYVIKIVVFCLSSQLSSVAQRPLSEQDVHKSYCRDGQQGDGQQGDPEEGAR